MACHEDNQDLKHLKDVRDAARAAAKETMKGTVMGAALAAGMVVALAWMAPASTVAHHSFAAEFDEDKPVKVTGKVTSMRWSNPHGWIYVDVTGPDGKT